MIHDDILKSSRQVDFRGLNFGEAVEQFVREGAGAMLNCSSHSVAVSTDARELPERLEIDGDRLDCAIRQCNAAV